MRVLIGVLVTLLLTVAGYEVRAQGTPEAAGCEGLAEYETAMTPIGKAYVDGLNANGLFDRKVETLSPDEWMTTSNLMQDFQTAVKAITPPPVATEWHQKQIEFFGTYSSMAQAASNEGIGALLSYRGTLNEIVMERTAAADIAIEACPAFDDFLNRWDLLDGRVDRQATPAATPTN